MNNENIIVGAVLRNYRLKSRLALWKLGVLVGKSPASLCRVERGGIKDKKMMNRHVESYLQYFNIHERNFKEEVSRVNVLSSAGQWARIPEYAEFLQPQLITEENRDRDFDKLFADSIKLNEKLTRFSDPEALVFNTEVNGRKIRALVRGFLFRGLRKTKGISMVDLSKACGMYYRKVQNFESGHRDLNDESLGKLLEVLGFPPSSYPSTVATLHKSIYDGDWKEVPISARYLFVEYYHAKRQLLKL